MPSQRPIDKFITHSLSLLQQDFVVIGKTRVRSWEAWIIIGFLVGITLTFSFLASRTATLVGTEAAATIEQQLSKAAVQMIASAEKMKNTMLAAAQKTGVTIPDLALSRYQAFINRATAERDAEHPSEAIRFAAEATASINHIPVQRAIQDVETIIQKKVIPLERVDLFLQAIAQGKVAFAKGDYAEAKRLAESAQKMLAPASAAKMINEAQKVKNAALVNAQKTRFTVPPETIATFDNLLIQAHDALNKSDVAGAEKLAMEAMDAISYPTAQKIIKETEAYPSSKKFPAVSAHTLEVFNSFLSQAKAAYEKGMYAEAKRLALQAQKNVNPEGAKRLMDAAQKTRTAALKTAQGNNFTLPVRQALDMSQELLLKASSAFAAGDYAASADYAQGAVNGISYSEADRLIKNLEATRANKEKIGEILSPEQFDRLSSLFNNAKEAFTQGDYRTASMYITDTKRSIDSRETQSVLAGAEKSKSAIVRNAGKRNVPPPAAILGEYDELASEARTAYEKGDYLASRRLALQAYGKVVGDPTVALLSMNPSGGESKEGVLVSLFTDAPGAAIRYTSDGSIPTEKSSYYTGPISIFETTTLKARVFVGRNGSIVQEAAYVLPPGVHLPELPPTEQGPSSEPEPESVPTQGQEQSPISFSSYEKDGYKFDGSVRISLSSNDPSLAIYYTTDGRTPSSSVGVRYTGPFEISRTSVVKAQAYKGGTMVGGMAHGVFLEKSSYAATKTGGWGPLNQAFFGENKFNIIIVNLPDEKLLTRAGVEQAMFTDSETSLDAWYRTVSFGQMWASGSIFGPYTASLDPDDILLEEQQRGSAYNNACNTLGRLSKDAVLEQARKDGFVETSDAETIIFLNAPHCLGSLGVSYNYFFGRVPVGSRFDVGLYGNLVHELHDGASHTHSGGLDCGAKAIDSLKNCLHTDIADPFSVQGSIWEAYNMIAQLRDIVGWFPPGRLETITQAGTYTLSTVSRKEMPDQNSALAYRIAAPALGPSSSYYIEYNQPVGSDAILRKHPGFTRGINVRVAQMSGVGTALLDVSPETKSPTGCNTSLERHGACPFLDATLSDGRTFEDIINGIKITQVSHDAQVVTIKVEFTGPQNSGPVAETIPTLPPISTNIPPSGPMIVTHPDLFAQGPHFAPFGFLFSPGESVTAVVSARNLSALVPAGTFRMRLHPNFDVLASPPGFSTASVVKDVVVNLFDKDWGREMAQEVSFNFKMPASSGWKVMYFVVDDGDPGSVDEVNDSIEGNSVALRYYVVDPAFTTGKRVKTNRAVNIYGSPYSNITGSQSAGMNGTVVSAAVDQQTSTAWIYVNFDDGKKGFVFVDFLVPI